MTGLREARARSGATESITVRIGSAERDLRDADAGWITSQIRQHRAAGEAVCVVLSVTLDRMNLRLATPTCSSGGGGGRPPNTREAEIIALWSARGLNQPDFAPGNLVAFLRQLVQAVG